MHFPQLASNFISNLIQIFYSVISSFNYDYSSTIMIPYLDFCVAFSTTNFYLKRKIKQIAYKFQQKPKRIKTSNALLYPNDYRMTTMYNFQRRESKRTFKNSSFSFCFQDSLLKRP